MESWAADGLPPEETAVWTRVHGVCETPLDLLTARFLNHRFAPHSHDEFAIGVCVDGREVIGYRGAAHRSGPGSLVVAEPGETHTGGPDASGGFAYRVLYPSAGLVAEDTGGPGRCPHFPDLVIHDAGLSLEIARIHMRLVDGGGLFETESRLVELFRVLVTRYAAGARPPVPLRRRDATRVALAVRERLDGRLADPPALAELADDLGLSRYQTLRAFRDAVGLPPYAWLAQHRVARARTLLEAGARPSEAAARVGFADQAHLTRWFRRVVGVTPGAYRAEVAAGRGPRPGGGFPDVSRAARAGRGPDAAER